MAEGYETMLERASINAQKAGRGRGRRYAISTAMNMTKLLQLVLPAMLT